MLRRDWAAAMPYFWQAFGLAEAVADSGDLYGCSEIRRHIGFYYLVQDVRPGEAARRLGYPCGSSTPKTRSARPKPMPRSSVTVRHR